MGGGKREADFTFTKYSLVVVKRAVAVRAGVVAKILQFYQFSRICYEKCDAFGYISAASGNVKGEEWLKQPGIRHFGGEVSGAENGDVVNRRESLQSGLRHVQISGAVATFSPV